MRNALLIASLDFRRLRMLPVTAAALGMLVLLARFLPSMRPSDVPELTLICALISAYALGTISAFSAGGMLFAKELSEKRLSFLYARPLSTFSIVAGKALAAITLIATSIAVALAPALIVYGRSAAARTTDAPLNLLLITATLMTTGVLLAHLTTLGFNDKSVWLLVSFVALSAGIAVITLTIRELLIPSEWSASETLPLIFIAAGSTILIAIVATVLGVIKGRALLRSVHRVTAITLAIGMGLLSLLVLGGAYWLTHPSVHDIHTHDVVISPDDRHIVAVGTRMGVPSSFLVNTTGAQPAVRLGSFTSAHSFSADGKTLAWTKNTRDSHFLHVWKIQAGKPRETTLEGERWNPSALSPSGRYLAKVGNNVELYDLEDGDRLIKSVALSEDSRSHRRVEFSGEDTLILTPRTADTKRVTIRSIHGTPQMLKASYPVNAGSFLSIDGGRLKTRKALEGDSSSHAVVDILTGETLWELKAANLNSLSVMFLPDGGLLTAQRMNTKSIWTVYDASLGKAVRTFETIPLSIGASLSTTEISASTRWDQPATTPRKTYVINWNSGTVREVAAGLRPSGAFQRYIQNREPTPGSLATRIFHAVDQNDASVYFNPLTGERRVLAGKQ